MSQCVAQNMPADIVVILTDAANNPVTGLTDADIAVEYLKEGALAFVPYALAGNLTEIGSGVYKISFSASELDTPGSFTIKVTGVAITQYVSIATVLAVGTVPPTTVTVEVCVVTGHIFDVGGNPIAGAAISARVLAFPLIEQNSINLSVDTVSTTTNSSGEFFLTLVRMAEVEIFIPKTNYRRQLTVPNLPTANLFTGIP